MTSKLGSSPSSRVETTTLVAELRATPRALYIARPRHDVLERTMLTAGYSGTPLAKKLGLTPGMRLLARGAPPAYASWIAPAPEGLVLVQRATSPTAVHLFVTARAELERQLATLRRSLVETGFVWVSWPKKAAKVPTDVSEEVIRAVALPMGFVDVKVCAVNETWSGLKLVIRVSERTKGAR